MILFHRLLGSFCFKHSKHRDIKWLTDNRYRYRYRADICHIGRQSVSVVLYMFTDCVKPIVEKIHAVQIICIARGNTDILYLLGTQGKTMTLP